MKPNNRAPALDPMLQPDNPTLETLKRRALHDLAEAANTLQALTDLVRNLKGIKEPEKYGPHYRLDEWASLIRGGHYKAARLFILDHHT